MRRLSRRMRREWCMRLVMLVRFAVLHEGPRVVLWRAGKQAQADNLLVKPSRLAYVQLEGVSRPGL